MRCLPRSPTPASFSLWRRRPPGFSPSAASRRRKSRPRARSPSPLRRRARHPQLSRIRRAWPARLRHRPRPSPPQADSRPPASTPRASRSTSRASAPAPGRRRLYISTIKQLMCLDLVSEKLLWEKTYESGCDRMAITPDGRTIFLPSFEGPLWYVVRRRGRRGDRADHPEVGRAQHDRRAGREAKAYLAGLNSPNLTIVDTRTHQDRRHVRPVQREHPPVHDQRRPDALLRERQPAARLRGRRPGHGPEALSGRGDGLPAGADQAARLPEPRDRPDARRPRALADRRVQPPDAHLRRDRDAAEADRRGRAPRRAGLDHLQHRRPPRPTRRPAT